MVSYRKLRVDRERYLLLRYNSSTKSRKLLERDVSRVEKRGKNSYHEKRTYLYEQRRI
jgi:hypothetical protein